MSHPIRKHLIALAACSALIAFPLAAVGQAAAPGDLDASLGGAGRVHVPLGDRANASAVAVQPDGGIVVAGSAGRPRAFAIARLLPNGGLDPAFGGDGTVTTPIGTSAAPADVVVQPDGRIVVLGSADDGTTNSDFAFARYLPDGRLDGSFGGGDGIVVVSFGSADRPDALALGPAGEIVGVGVVDPGGVAVAMLEADGRPATRFAGDGTTVVATDVQSPGVGTGVAVQDDGRIVLSARSGSGRGDGFRVARLRGDGALDRDFNGNGIVRTPIPGDDNPQGDAQTSDVLVQPDGQIVVGGRGFDEVGGRNDAKFALVRYTVTGDLDLSFGHDGIQTAQLSSGDDDAFSLNRDSDGRLVLAGTYDADVRPMFPSPAPAVVRFDPSGLLDASFGAGGSVLRPLPPGVESESIEDAAVQADGRIVTVGSESRRDSQAVAVARYLASAGEPGGGPQPPPPAEAPPAVSPPAVQPPPSRPAPNGEPDTDMRRIPRSIAARRLTSFSGTASDPDGIRQVQIALVRRAGSACHLLRSRDARFQRRRRGRGGCPRRWLTASGTTSWRYRLRRSLPPGTYDVVSRAIDSRGLAERNFTVGDRNRFTFRVTSR